MHLGLCGGEEFEEEREVAINEGFRTKEPAFFDSNAARKCYQTIVSCWSGGWWSVRLRLRLDSLA